MTKLSVLFGKKIRLLRRSKDFTQEYLAELAGISLQNIGDIERGIGNPTLATVEKIAEALQEEFSSMFDFGSVRLGNREQSLQELEQLLLKTDELEAQKILAMVKILLAK